MTEGDINKSIFYCKECGWNILSSKIEEIYGENDGNYFCFECGANLVLLFSNICPNSHINNGYPLIF